MPARLPRSVKALGFVSLLTDASSEMIYPLLPSFLTRTLAAGPAFVGLVEGIAEAAATLLKVVSGRLSDRLGRRKPLIVAGYTLSSAARPLVSLAAAPWHVLAVRLADRLGKGLRGAPRDALIAAVTPAAQRGRAFGLQRAMDHAGAMLGPLLASALLAWGADTRSVFALAAVPAALSVLVLVRGVSEAAGGAPPPASRAEATAAPAVDPPVRQPPLVPYLGTVALFTLGNSSDAFLLLRAQEAGIGLAAIPLLWTFHHAVKSSLSTLGGALSDRLGRRAAIAGGWLLYALAYAGFAFVREPLQLWLLFGLYGLFHALTEGPERALVADLAAERHRGRAFGLFHGVTGAMLLPASLLTGILWQAFGARTALLTGAALAGAAALALLLLVRPPER